MTSTLTQEKQSEWHEQWSMLQDNERFLFDEWIQPATIEDFRDKDVLECGCGGGQHTNFVASAARSVTAVDLNTTDIARVRNAANHNVTFVEADIASMNLGRRFDVVYCIGVIHHTDNPTRTFENIFSHVKPGGMLIVWTYSEEGNFLVKYAVEPIRKAFLRNISRAGLLGISRFVTAAMYPFIYSIYLLPFMSFLPFFEYFKNFRRMSFERNVLNVFDKLNAPQTEFTSRRTAEAWMNAKRFLPESVSIRHYAGVSYSLVGIRRED
jgi:SAM-dependent methyltransferase